MGIIKQGILGGFSGKVGNVVGASWKGIDYIRSLPSSVSNPRTPGKEGVKNMNDNLKKYLDSLMRPIPSGVEEIRIYKDDKKWISSDSKMSIPGKKGNLLEEKKEVEIHSFLLAKYPVTK